MVTGFVALFNKTTKLDAWEGGVTAVIQASGICWLQQTKIYTHYYEYLAYI